MGTKLIYLLIFRKLQNNISANVTIFINKTG